MELYGILGLGALAALMALTTAILVKWASEAETASAAATIAFLLAMMAAMLGGALVYLVAPSTTTLVAGLWVAGGVMSVSVFPLFYVVVREIRRRLESPESGPGRLVRRGPFTAVVVALVLANELLMGWTFSLASGVGWGGPGGAGPVGIFVAAVDSPWFLFTMAAEMLFTAIFLRSRLPRAVTGLLLAQGAVMAFSPPAIADGGWVLLSVVVSSAVMTGIVVFVMEYLYRDAQLAEGLARYLWRLLAVYAGMMAGLFVWLYDGNAIGFAVAVVVEMVLYFDLVVSPAALTGPLARPWQLDRRWTTGLLATIFLAELFMGAVLDIAISPASYFAPGTFLPLAGSLSTVVEHAVSNGFWFVATVTASTWFLAMMGIEMGTLVVYKIRETRHRENQIRLGLMIGCYAAFAVFYPSVYFAAAFPNAPNPSQVPMLGWSMGIGSFPIAVGVFGAIALTYLITGVLSVLFGRRAICSTFCTAPLMYQGTTFDRMKSFNRSSPFARRYLSSRLSRAYGWTTAVTLAALTTTSLVSYLNSLGWTRIDLLGSDPSVFLYALSFSVLWYVMFIAVPYAGNYNCVTMGWCYTGTIAQAFQKIGFFKLKVRRRELCWSCTTLDCAKECPIGLVDMPGHFRQKGEFRSSKCCGVGDCIERCPYDNIYIADIRSTVRRWLGRPEAGPARPPRPTSTPPAPGRSPAVPASLAGADTPVVLPVIRPPRAESGASGRTTANG